MAKPKLTPTFNDKAKEAGGLPKSKFRLKTGREVHIGDLHIIPAHEPLSGEAFALPEPQPLDVVPDASPEPPALTVPAEAKPPGFKVALVGTAPSSRGLAPYNDRTYQIWGCSPGNMDIPRFDEWFEIHNNLLWPEHQSYGIPYVEWMRKQTCPIWMQDQNLVPNAKSLPWRELVREFSPYFFTSSFAWMAAFAMTRGATEILLYGIDMASRDEYIVQRAGFYYFFLESKKRGIRMGAPSESDIMQPPPLYGFHDASSFGRKMHTRKKEITDRIAALEQQERQAHENLVYLRGAQEDNDYIINIWGGAQSI